MRRVMIDPHPSRQDRLTVWGDMRPTTMSQGENLTVERTLDGAFLTSVANDQKVRPFLGGSGELDLSIVVGDPKNYTFQSAYGGFIAMTLGQGRYEVHSLFLPTAPKDFVFAIARDALAYMFARTDCVELLTKVPANNLAAHALAVAGGFQSAFKRESAWETDLGLVAVDYRSLSLERWALRTDACADAGKQFHDELEAAKAQASSTAAIHADDAVHDAMVGAAVLMIRAGNTVKAVWSYNRWAAFAGYAQISIVSENPIVIDVVDAVVEIDGSNMKALICR